MNLNTVFDERRKFVRVNFCQVITINEAYLNKELMKNSFFIATANISLGGIGAICEEELPLNMEFDIKCNIENSTYSTKVKISYCVKTGVLYRIGLEFLNPEANLLNDVKRYVLRESLDENNVVAF